MSLYKRVKSDEAPRRERFQPPRFAGTREWALMKQDIDRGFPKGEELVLSVTEEYLASIPIKDSKTIHRFILGYLREKGLEKKLQVRSGHRDGLEFVKVRHFQPSRQ